MLSHILTKKQSILSVCVLYLVVCGLQSAFCTQFAVCILYWPKYKHNSIVGQNEIQVKMI